MLPNVGKHVGKVNIPPLIIADSAFPQHTWLMKPYTDAVLRPQQKYFNYKLSRARMVSECAYGQLKGRWRVLPKKNESDKEQVRITVLACMVLHNVCIMQGDTISKKLDLTIDPASNEKKEGEEVRKLLQMRESKRIHDNSKEASAIRNSLTVKLFAEKESGIVS